MSSDEIRTLPTKDALERTLREWSCCLCGASTDVYGKPLKSMAAHFWQAHGIRAYELREILACPIKGSPFVTPGFKQERLEHARNLRRRGLFSGGDASSKSKPKRKTASFVAGVARGTAGLLRKNKADTGERHRFSKISDAQRLEIQASTASSREIAGHYGLSRQGVDYVRQRPR